MIRFLAALVLAIAAANALANTIDATPADTGFQNARAQMVAADR